jgi:hypothetical protein
MPSPRAKAGNSTARMGPEEAAKQWKSLVANSLRLRLDQDKFRHFAEELHDRAPIAGLKLASIMIESRRASGKIVDPRITLFVEQLLELHVLSSYDVLAALFREYSIAVEAEEGVSSSNICELATNILDHLTRRFVTSKSPRTIAETRHALQVLSKWLGTVAFAEIDGQSLLQSLDQRSVLLCDALGLLAIGMLENVRVCGVVEKAVTSGTSAFPRGLEKGSIC